jgi:uncharacterized membrane protein
MPDLSTGRLKKAAAVLLVLAAFAVVLAVGAYVVNFGPASGFNLSRSDGAWSNFGSYLGGVLSPAFAFLAFIAVLVTVWLQAKQLEHAKQQSHLEELQRVVAVVSKTIDDLLAQPAGPSSNRPVATLAELTVYDVLSAAGTRALNTTTDWITRANNSALIQFSKDTLLLQAGTLLIELEQLVWCLQEYEKEGGSSTVADFYKRRYDAIVCWLDLLERLNSSGRVHDYFKPKDFRQYLSPSL